MLHRHILVNIVAGRTTYPIMKIGCVARGFGIAKALCSHLKRLEKFNEPWQSPAPSVVTISCANAQWETIVPVSEMFRRNSRNGCAKNRIMRSLN